MSSCEIGWRDMRQFSPRSRNAARTFAELVLRYRIARFETSFCSSASARNARSMRSGSGRIRTRSSVNMRSTDSASSASSSDGVSGRSFDSSSIHIRRCMAWTPFAVTRPGVRKNIVPMRLTSLPSASLANILSPIVFMAAYYTIFRSVTVKTLSCRGIYAASPCVPD